MIARAGLLVLALTLTACAASGRAQVEPVTPPPAPVAKAPPAPEPPRQADQLARIVSELTELQNAIAKLMMSARQHDDQLIYLQRRITDLETQLRGGRSAIAPTLPPAAAMPAPLPPPPIAAPAPVAPPALPPTASPRVAAPSAPGPIVSAPSAAPRSSPPVARPPAPPSAGTATPADELYRDGLTKYQSGDLDGAIVTLYEVVANYPAEPARERAQFLVGEIFYAQKDYRGAVAELESLIDAVPGGTRVPEALLKIGMAQRSLGDEARARRAWERLVKEYPATPAARQARTLLRGRG